MARFRYNPLVDPKPTRIHRGWASRAQRRHFLAAPGLRRYIGGNDFYTPPRGRRTSLPDKLAALPARLHPKRRKRSTR